MKNQEHIFPTGGLEIAAFEITTDSSAWGGKQLICPHAHSVEVDTVHDDYTTYQWIVPRVLVVYNQGGYAKAKCCLDCILEAEKTLPQ